MWVWASVARTCFLAFVLLLSLFYFPKSRLHITSCLLKASGNSPSNFLLCWSASFPIYWENWRIQRSPDSVPQGPTYQYLHPLTHTSHRLLFYLSPISHLFKDDPSETLHSLLCHQISHSLLITHKIFHCFPHNKASVSPIYSMNKHFFILFPREKSSLQFLTFAISKSFLPLLSLESTPFGLKAPTALNCSC